jgi:hypothetical protein
MNRSPNRRLLACFGAAYLAVVVFWACGGGPDLPPGGGTTYSQDAATGRGSDASGVSEGADARGGSASDRGGDGAGVSGDADAGDNDAGDGGSPEAEAGEGAADSQPPVCDPMATWASPGSVEGLPTGQGVTAFTATPDELTVAWVQPTPGSDGGIEVHSADRTSTAAPFGPAQTVAAAAAYGASDGIALTFDGLGLVVVRADRKALAQLTRSSRSATFGDPDETPFQGVNATVVVTAGSMVGLRFAYLGDPVLGPDDLTLMYSGYGGNQGASGSVSVYESRRSSSQAPFPPVTVEHDMGPLAVVRTPASAGQNGPCGTCGTGTDGGISESSAADASLIEARRHPTGLSSDGRTVFYWDSLASGAGRSAWRSDGLGEFASSEIVGSDAHAIVANASCTRLYFVQAGEFRVVEATR